MNKTVNAYRMKVQKEGFHFPLWIVPLLPVVVFLIIWAVK